MRTRSRWLEPGSNRQLRPQSTESGWLGDTSCDRKRSRGGVVSSAGEVRCCPTPCDRRRSRGGGHFEKKFASEWHPQGEPLLVTRSCQRESGGSRASFSGKWIGASSRDAADDAGKREWERIAWLS